ncbi:MAG: hypothetical protein JJU25_04985 [Halomonas sp.]|nr:hypothetical protein [Halomonas sp.]MCC5881975.1 hypothetical protein [Halomonas sp.]
MLRLGLLLLILPILVLMGIYFWEFSQVRECTLVQGGYWDYLDATCLSSPQPFVPWVERQPWLVNGGMLLSVAGVFMCMVGLYVRRR